jgi:hypothetical protein
MKGTYITYLFVALCQLNLYNWYWVRHEVSKTDLVKGDAILINKIDNAKSPIDFLPDVKKHLEKYKDNDSLQTITITPLTSYQNRVEDYVPRMKVRHSAREEIDRLIYYIENDSCIDNQRLLLELLSSI